MKLPLRLAPFTSKLNHARNLVKELFTLVNNREQTYFRGSEQKSKWQILREQLMWILRNGELNRYYYVYGLDQKNESRSKGILGYRKFRRLRDKTNLHPAGLNFNYACLLRDKFMFGRFLSSLNIPTPKNIALIDRSGITWLDTMEKTAFEDIDLPPDKIIDGFCKKLTGLKGEGAFPLRFENGKIYIGGEEASVTQLKHRIDGSYLLQERLTQHPDMARIHPSSLNTLRILTFNNGGNIKLFCAAFRVGTKGKSVDNWGAGGIAIGVDITNGTVREYGKYKPGGGGCVSVHPDSGIVFNGYQIPFFRESAELVCNVHRYLYGIHSIGWDVAVGMDGPIIIEGNEGWDGSFTMCIEDDFKDRFLEMYRQP